MQGRAGKLMADLSDKRDLGGGLANGIDWRDAVYATGVWAVDFVMNCGGEVE